MNFLILLRGFLGLICTESERDGWEMVRGEKERDEREMCERE